MATVHVAPLRDCVEHDLDESCVCGPTSETVEDDSGRVAGFVVMHASLDGREGREHGWPARLLRLVGLRRRRWAVIGDDIERAF